ncbi:MAG: hypothetical protein QW420_04910 [Candidatus Caldarchaeum sp.]
MRRTSVAALAAALLAVLVLVTAEAQQENVTITINANPADCVTRVALFSETRRLPIRLTSAGEGRWVSEPIPSNEVVTVSYEVTEDCLDPIIVNDITLERFYGTRISQVITYDASYTIKARKQPLSYVTIRAEPAECLLSVTSSKPVMKDGDQFVIGPVKAGEAVNINPTINTGCTFKEYIGDPYAAASAKPAITLRPTSNITLTMVLTPPQPTPQTTEQKTEATSTGFSTMVQSLLPHLPLIIGSVVAAGGGYAAYRTASAAREKKRRQEELERRFLAAKAEFMQHGKNPIVRKGLLWLEVDPVKEVVEGTDTDRLLTAYLMLACVIPVSRDMRKRLYDETVDEYNAATGATLSGYVPAAVLYSSEQKLIKLSVQLALADADTVEKVRQEIRRRGKDPWIIPRRLVDLDAIVYQARGLSVYDLGFKLEGEEKASELEVVKHMSCPSCGTMVFESFTFCVKCGTRLRKDEEPPQPKERPATRVKKPAEQPAQPSHIEERAKPKQEKREERTRPRQPAMEPQPIEHTPVQEKAAQLEKPAAPALVETRAAAEWELPKWILDELAGLGVDPDLVKSVAEDIAYSSDVEKAAFRAAYAIAEEMGFTDRDELAAFATNLATLLPYAAQEYRAIQETMSRETEQTKQGKTTEQPPVEASPTKQAKVEAVEEKIMDDANPRHVESPAAEAKPQPEKAAEHAIHQPKPSEEQDIYLHELPRVWEPGTAYLLDGAQVLAPALPTGIVMRHLLELEEAIDLEKAARSYTAEVLSKMVERKRLLLVLTRGRYPRKRHKGVELERDYKPLRLLLDLAATVSSPEKLAILTHPMIFNALPMHVKSRLKVVTVRLDTDAASRVLKEKMHPQTSLSVAQGLLPLLADKLSEGEEALRAHLKEFLSDEDAEMLTKALYAASRGQPIPEEVPRALVLALGLAQVET